MNYSVRLEVIYNYVIRDHHGGWCSGADASENEDDYYIEKI